MALTAPSMFLYGYEITEYNRSLDFRASFGGPEKQATLTLGYYSLTGLMEEIKTQMEAADPANEYTITANRAVAGGTQNRVTISTDGGYLNLLFLSGTRNATTCATILGFIKADRTGATSYTGNSSSGTPVVPNLLGYNFLPPEYMRKNFGSVNVSASGVKEAIVYAIQKFWQVQFKYIPKTTATTEWVNLMTWMMLQRPIEFTPEITSPTVFYDGTLESTGADGRGLGFTLSEMLPQFPHHYDTGLMKFRVREG